MTKQKLTKTAKSQISKQTPHNYNGYQGEKNSLPSKTIPGETYTVKELLQKHLSGTMPAVGLTPMYDYDEPTHEDDIQHRSPDLDLSDIDTAKQKVQSAQETIKKAESAKATKAKKEALEKIQKDAVEKHKKEESEKTVRTSVNKDEAK